MTDRTNGMPGGAPVPTPWQPGDAYGSEGPGTLDRDARMVRPNDPLAPAARAQPAVPPMPLPKDALPTLSEHSPFQRTGGPFGTARASFGAGAPRGFAPQAAAEPETHTNGSYGVPMRSAQRPADPAAPPARRGSVAPPGLR